MKTSLELVGDLFDQRVELLLHMCALELLCVEDREQCLNGVFEDIVNYDVVEVFCCWDLFPSGLQSSLYTLGAFGSSVRLSTFCCLVWRGSGGSGFCVEGCVPAPAGVQNLLVD